MLRAIQTTVRVLQKRSNHFNAPHLEKCDANYAQLTPISPFLRTLKLFPSEPAYYYGGVYCTWSKMGKRVSSFASALVKAGIQRGDVVSVMAPNVPALFEAHFAVPGTGGVLHAINTRLDATTVAYQLTHAESKIFLVDDELVPIVAAAKDIMTKEGTKLPMFINIKDAAFAPAATAPQLGSVEYEEFLSSGDAGFKLLPCQDEWDAISLNYTSGTTGNPKGVICTHRGAYLNSINNIFEFNMERFARLLSGKQRAAARVGVFVACDAGYHHCIMESSNSCFCFNTVVPMFHCNGWFFTWTMANVAGCNFLVRQVRPDVVCNLIQKYVTLGSSRYCYQP
jgi:fatty-acyl-CoA synthase